METDRNFFAANRRTFLKCGIGAAGAIIRPISLHCAGIPYYKAVFDERFEEPRRFAAAAAARQIPAAAIRGDITGLFFHDLDLRWRQGPVRLAGFTTPAALFCLDLLARDRGMRLSHHMAEPSVEAALGVLDGAPPQRSLVQSGGPSHLVFWIIAPAARPSAKEIVNA